jgi:PTH1 family peptidyl-tRNA hydrolase
MAIRLIVGLGNPGTVYQTHRHNVGFWFVDALAHLYSSNFKKESRFFCDVATCDIANNAVRLIKPHTYMNRSGQSIQSIAKFYQINSSEILVVHDELDLNPGIARLKYSGGHGGHNGLRDTIKALGSNDFYRLRIGIGHPGNKARVSDFVLHAPNASEIEPIQSSLVESLNIIEKVIVGETEKAMKTLHTDE